VHSFFGHMVQIHTDFREPMPGVNTFAGDVGRTVDNDGSRSEFQRLVRPCKFDFLVPIRDGHENFVIWCERSAGAVADSVSVHGHCGNSGCFFLLGIGGSFSLSTSLFVEISLAGET